GAELLTNALDECPHVRPIALVSVAGHEIPAVHEVVDLTIGNVLAGALCQQGYDLELGQGQVDGHPGPARPVDVKAQLEPAETQDFTSTGRAGPGCPST